MENAYLLRTLPEKLQPLIGLALDLRWTWSHAGDMLWEHINPEVWERTQNPWLILQSTPRERLDFLCEEEKFVADMERLLLECDRYYNTPSWFDEQHAGSQLREIAYFSMEYGLGEALPLYAGGLGILAGDYLKAASDLGVPVTAVGLFYQQGYFRQMIDANGWQREFYPHNDPVSLPIRPVIGSDGNWLRITLPLPGRILLVRVWEVQVGMVKLYLLDTNDPMNSSVDRGITGELYVSDREVRFLQEMVLGFGGWRVLMAMGIEPDVCHLNEGHTAFAALERIRAFALRHGTGFDEAWIATRAGNLLTTHTPVAAGFDSFPPALAALYLDNYAEEMNIPLGKLIELGRCAPGDTDGFNMACLALRLSSSANAVSSLHGEVSRSLFQKMFPRWPQAEVPITHVTNGVHTPTWDSAFADRLWTSACGKERWLGTMESLQENIERVSDQELWSFRSEGRNAMVAYVRQRLAQQLGAQGASPDQIEIAHNILDPNTLTIGFARRFAEYKRPDLLLQDEARLIRLLNNPINPVQLVIAGKAHPDDVPGKEMIKRWILFAHRPEVRRRVVFLADYDLALAQEFAQGVDLWVNTPRRPWEACGTSGMKVLVNGGLNLSSLDGWWAEAYREDAGWALGDGRIHPDGDGDIRDAESLYRLLEKEIVPCFYARTTEGIPAQWVSRIRTSMATLTPLFSANRMVRDYIHNFYLRAAQASQRREDVENHLTMALSEWRRNIDQHWESLHFLNVSVEPGEETYHFAVQVYLDELSPDAVAVEVYADSGPDKSPFHMTMERTGSLQGAVNGYIYEADVPRDRPAHDYTPRVVPWHPEAQIPMEESHILWLP